MMGEGLETEWLSIHDGKDRVTNLPQAAGSVPWVVVPAVGARDRTEPPVNWALLSGGVSLSLGATDEAMSVALDT